MNRIFQLISKAVCITFILYAGCSGSDEPKPFNCAASDLAISLAPDGDVDPTSCSANDGSIQVTATGGEGPYTYAIGSGVFGNSAIFTNLGPGSFSITVKDSHTCTQTIDVALVAPGSPTVIINKTSDTNCTSPFNGSITVSATGGTEPYQYKLDAGSFTTNPVFEHLKDGRYVITVKDDANCIVTVNTTVAKGSTGINYIDDIKPIFLAKCNFSGCHPDNGDWFTYSVAKSNAEEIKRRTGNGEMPKDGGEGKGGPLSEIEIAKIACWVADRAPQN